MKADHLFEIRSSQTRSCLTQADQHSLNFHKMKNEMKCEMKFQMWHEIKLKMESEEKNRPLILG